ncbi:MAG: bifunctional phosphopantothenoylcysteine decarboxylase/phosphopantothenate--cysteine ligase CoaBC [Flavobacteriaceae bacterium]|tara:strand:+ start:22210 stop:23415 length:1206 start_codon:yes stop_codon:yes gene_type:complete
MLRGKNILLGISGGIAAYKTPYLVRLLIKAGANVKIVLTENASHFVSPLTLATLSENPVAASFTVLDEIGSISWNNHVTLGLWADLMIVAPATASSLSKMAYGQADNLLIVTYLSAKCSVFIAPAMDLDMYKHQSTKESLVRLKSFGHYIIPAEDGFLASGLSGEGRMAEPENILLFVEKTLSNALPLKGKKVLITAGPTYEPIDPVRFIGNHSSGLMGYELAEQAYLLGACVTLVSGPSHLTLYNKGIQKIMVTTAIEMQEAVMQEFENCDIFIGAAAVSDYRPMNFAKQKIKKEGLEAPKISLVKNPDIIAVLGQIKKHQILIGFALETQDGLKYANQKLINKNLDAIVLNTLEDNGAGFSHTTNKIVFIKRDGQALYFDLKPKKEVAEDIWREIQIIL